VEEETRIINYYCAKIGLPQVILVLILISKMFTKFLSQSHLEPKKSFSHKPTLNFITNAGNYKAEIFYLPELIPQFSVNGAGKTMNVFSPPEIITAELQSLAYDIKH
jgi:hypothetical protein